MNFFDILNGLMPSDEASPQSVRSYRLRVALVACSAWIVVFVFVLPAFFVGVPVVGRVAFASDVDDKISRAVAPIQRDIAELKNDIQAQTAATNAALAELAYREVQLLVRQRCASTNDRDRDRLQALIRAQELRYRRLSSDLSYVAPSCADL